MSKTIVLNEEDSPPLFVDGVKKQVLKNGYILQEEKTEKISFDVPSIRSKDLNLDKYWIDMSVRLAFFGDNNTKGAEFSVVITRHWDPSMQDTYNQDLFDNSEFFFDKEGRDNVDTVITTLEEFLLREAKYGSNWRGFQQYDELMHYGRTPQEVIDILKTTPQWSEAEKQFNRAVKKLKDYLSGKRKSAVQSMDESIKEEKFEYNGVDVINGQELPWKLTHTPDNGKGTQTQIDLDIFSDNEPDACWFCFPTYSQRKGIKNSGELDWSEAYDDVDSGDWIRSKFPTYDSVLKLYNKRKRVTQSMDEGFEKTVTAPVNGINYRCEIITSENSEYDSLGIALKFYDPSDPNIMVASWSATIVEPIVEEELGWHLGFDKVGFEDWVLSTFPTVESIKNINKRRSSFTQSMDESKLKFDDLVSRVKSLNSMDVFYMLHPQSVDEFINCEDEEKIGNWGVTILQYSKEIIDTYEDENGFCMYDTESEEIVFPSYLSTPNQKVSGFEEAIEIVLKKCLEFNMKPVVENLEGEVEYLFRQDRRGVDQSMDEGLIDQIDAILG